MKDNRKKIVVTGASGFIGTNLLEDLSSKFEVINIDSKKPKNAEYIKYWKDVDLLDYQKLRREIVAFNPDYIVHLAARTDLDGQTIEDYSANTIGVKNVLKIVSELPDLKKILITSSMLVCHAGYYPKNQFDYSPTTVYGESKVETEKIVWENKPNCDWAIIRPSSIWGPWFGVPYRNFFDMVISKRYFHIGNKGCTKTYGYVGNAIYQIKSILFADTTDENNKVFYLGDYEPTNIEEWGNEIANQLGQKIMKMPYWLIKCAALFGDFLKVFGINFPMTSFRLKNMTTDNIINLSNTRKIAPLPPYSRCEGIKNTLDWLKCN